MVSKKIVRITTGAPLPLNADAVVMVEETELVQASKDQTLEQIVRIKKGVQVRENVRLKGSDIAKGEKVLGIGTEIGPSEIGILASIGVSEVLVYSKPVVAILSTGEEIVEFNEIFPTENPKIRDSNRPTLIAALKSEGCKVIDLGISGDKYNFFYSFILFFKKKKKKKKV
mgnify:CR=1 FL=1